jgi:hypothetical protein
LQQQQLQHLQQRQRAPHSLAAPTTTNSSGCQHHQQHSQQQQQQQQHADPAGARRHRRRALQQHRPSHDGQHAARRGRLSGGHLAGVALLSLAAMGMLAFMAYKAMQWLDRVRRPGYVELQALDASFHRPTFTL